MSAPEHPRPHDGAAQRSAADRRQLVIGGGLIVVIIVAMTLFFALNARYFKPQNGSQVVGASNGPSLDRPYAGKEPSRPGDRGGWEQLALLGLIVVALGGGSFAVVHSSRRARRAQGTPRPSEPASPVRSRAVRR